MALNINSLKIKEMTMLTDQQRDELLANRPAETVTKERIESLIVAMAFWTPYEASTLTICVLTLGNGFEVVGKSACANPENFDPELGKKIAYDDAFNKVWELEGYLLKEALYLQAAYAGQDTGNVAMEAQPVAETAVPQDTGSPVDTVTPVDQSEAGQSEELTEAAGEVEQPVAPVSAAAEAPEAAEQTPEAQPVQQAQSGTQEAA